MKTQPKMKNQKLNSQQKSKNTSIISQNTNLYNPSLLAFFHLISPSRRSATMISNEKFITNTDSLNTFLIRVIILDRTKYK